ncbi:MAG: RloB domain-containing protein [Cryomorphaceae bacterium]|nr:RloB domain-containing protein [Cryomorphaceae bacterium]
MSKNNKKQTFSKMYDELRSQSPAEHSVSVDKIPERKYYLIVTEGKSTEPIYFNHFKSFLPKELLETIDVKGEGDNTVNIATKAIEYRSKRKATTKPNYDEVWIVFDLDDFGDERFNKAVRIARQEGLYSAHTNPAFEFWYLLHFHYFDACLSRQDFTKMLTKRLGFRYDKSDEKVVKVLFNDRRKIHQAIKHAKRLFSVHKGKSPAKSCPSTSVHLLVESLLKYCNSGF